MLMLGQVGGPDGGGGGETWEFYHGNGGGSKDAGAALATQTEGLD